MNKFFLTTLVFLAANFLLAQTDTLKTELSEVTVSANKYETPTLYTASSVSVITSKEISLNQSNSVVEILKEVPGISVSQQGGTGKLSSVFMRGANSNFVLVMIDDVEVNDPSSANNAFDFSSLQVSDIERIEIVRGPQSTLYGSEAAAGIINIITKTGSGKPSYKVLGEGGTNNYYKGSISGLGEYSGLNYLVNFSRLQTDGISSIRGNNFETDGYLNNSAFIKIGYKFDNNLNLKASYKLINTETDLDQAEKNGDDPNFTSDWNSHLFNLVVDGSFLNGLWESSLRGSLYKNDISTLDKIDETHPSTSSNSNYKGNRLSFNWQNNLRFFDNNLLTIGLNHKLDEASSSYHSEGIYGPFDSEFPQKSISTSGIYIQDLVTLGQFSSTFGYRFDKNQKFGSVSTFRIAPMYFINSTKTKLKVTYGTGFQAPSLFNLFAPFYGNEKLKPEKSEGWDLGFEQFFFNNNVVVGVTYFNMKFEDMLGFDATFKSININKAETSGIESTLKFQNIYGFSLAANYTYNESFDISSTEASKKQLIRRPKNQFNINVDYDLNKINLGLSARYSGERFDNDFSAYPAARVTLKPYTLIDFRASYKVTDYLSLFGRIENILDKDYEDILYFGTLSRSGYLGFNLEL